MNRHVLALSALTLLICSNVCLSQAAKPASSAPSGFEQFTSLAGEWVGTGMHGDMQHDLRVVYKVTSGGSTVVETIDPGAEHEMVTIIHPDGDSLLLTHYCMLGNQPQMRARPKPGDKQVPFEFERATNLASDKDMYMRSVTYTFVDADSLKAEWTHYNEGKEAGKAEFTLKRKKP